MEKGIEVCHNLKDNSATVKGMELTLQIMLNALKKFEIFQINPQNSSFDPNKHEAMAMQLVIPCLIIEYCLYSKKDMS
jgi:molecular chaperone GrpE